MTLHKQTAANIGLEYSKERFAGHYLDASDLLLDLSEDELVQVLNEVVDAYIWRAAKTVLFESELEYIQEQAHLLMDPNHPVTETVDHIVWVMKQVLLGDYDSLPD